MTYQANTFERKYGRPKNKESVNVKQLQKLTRKKVLTR